MGVNRNQTHLRQLYLELASALPSSMTFQDIADMFYKFGIMDKPEKPYPDYPGNKRDYVLEKLSAGNTRTILESMPDIIWNSANGVDDDKAFDSSSVEWSLKRLGYKKIPEPSAPEELELYTYELPSNLDEIAKPILAVGPRRIDEEGLPNQLAEVIHELNDNLDRDNKIASALLVRRALTLATYIAMKRRGKDGLLHKLGKDVELNAALSLCQQEYQIPAQTIARVRSAKWLSDSANHSYLIKINASDIETAVTGLRIYLAEAELYQL
jgi:hypothetical protein